MIWKRAVTLEALNAMGAENMVGLLDIQFTRIGDNELEATMPVDNRTHQPFGLLHGGASVVLAETLGRWRATCVRKESRRWWVWRSMPTTSAPFAAGACAASAGRCMPEAVIRCGRLIFWTSRIACVVHRADDGRCVKFPDVLFLVKISRLIVIYWSRFEHKRGHHGY